MASRYRLAEFKLDTNNATHIQQVVLALVEAGFEVETDWKDDGCWLSLWWNDRVVE